MPLPYQVKRFSDHHPGRASIDVNLRVGDQWSPVDRAITCRTRESGKRSRIISKFAALDIFAGERAPKTRLQPGTEELIPGVTRPGLNFKCPAFPIIHSFRFRFFITCLNQRMSATRPWRWRASSRPDRGRNCRLPGRCRDLSSGCHPHRWKKMASGHRRAGVSVRSSWRLRGREGPGAATRPGWSRSQWPVSVVSLSWSF